MVAVLISLTSFQAGELFPEAGRMQLLQENLLWIVTHMILNILV